MKDNFVTTFKSGLKRALMMLVVIVAVSASVSAQYVDKDTAIDRLQSKATQVSNAISNLPATSLDYRFGLVQIFTYKAIYAEIVGRNASVNAAVETVFATLDSKTDGISDHNATITEYNKKNKISAFDTYSVIKNDVKTLLK